MGSDLGGANDPGKGDTLVSPLDTIVRKYAALCNKYTALVHKFEDLTHERFGAYQLAWWALGTTESGLAAVRDGAMLVTNVRFDELDRGVRARWSVVGQKRSSHPSLRDLVVAEASALDAAGGPARSLRARRAGARPLTVEVQLERVVRDGAPPTMTALVRDIADKIAGERELAAARQTALRRERLRVLGEIASGVAHDLNNSLNALTLRVDAMAADPKVQAARPGELAAMGRILADTAAVVARLQELSRRRKDQPDAVVDLGAIVADTVALVRSGLEQHGELRRAIVLQVSARLAPDLPSVAADAAELRQMLLNLIINARDAMPHGGNVVVEGAVIAGRVRLTVTDEGTGISPRALKHIFEPFFTTKGKRGTGLGLALAANMMHRLGGSIAAANRPGGGAVFTLEFPAAPAAARASAERVVARPPHASLRVLLIDDEADNLQALGEVIQLDGHEVTAVLSGAEAIERVRDGARYDLVLCDVGMPELSGWEVTRALHRLAPEMVLYLLTGWAKEIARQRPRAGVAGVLAKPITGERLRAVVSATLALRQPAAPTLHIPDDMADEKQGGPKKRGFAAMDEEKQRQISRKGGESVPVEKRSFSQDRELAAQAGRKGGAARGAAGRAASSNSSGGDEDVGDREEP